MKKWYGIAVVAGMLMAGIGQVAQAADDYKKFGIRVRGIYVATDESTGGALSTVQTSVSDDVIPEVDFEYFFVRNMSVEAIAGVTRHDIKLGNGTAVGLNNGYAGSTWLLPPTVTLKFHPMAGSSVSPYIGLGMNVVLPFSSRLNGVGDFKIDNSVGWAVQAGTDFKLTDNMYFNVDYKYLNADTKARVLGNKYKLDLNPHLVGVGVGYRF